MEIFFEEIQEGVLVVGVQGSLDRKTSDGFLERIDALIEGGVQKLVLDCTGLEYVSSLGLGVLVRVRKRFATAGRDIRIAGVSGTVAEMLRITRLDRVFDFYPDVDAALQAFDDRDPDDWDGVEELETPRSP